MTPKIQYDKYLEICANTDEEPMTFDEWFKMKYEVIL